MGVVNTENRNWTKAFGLDTKPLSVDVYTSQDQYQRELETIFAHCWLNVGRVEDVPNVGDYVVHNLPALSTSVVIARDVDGNINAFHNMCSHRGNKVCQERSGNAKYMVCEFHGWVFDTKGQLRDIPDQINFFDVDKAALGLKAVAVDVWEGFIFINLDANPKETLIEYLGELVPLLDGFPFSKYSQIFGYEGEVNCNWKVSVDSQQEAYHAAHLHRRTLNGALGGKENPFIHCLDFKDLGRHRMLSMPAGDEPPRKPIDKLAAENTVSIRSYAEGQDFSQWPSGVNPSRADNWAADIYVIFPNFWIALFNGMYQTHNFWPLGVDKMYQRITMRAAQPTKPSQRWALEYSRCMSRDVWLEDFSTLEAAHEMAKSGAFKEMHFQDQEVLCRHFHKVVGEYVGGAYK